MHFVQINVELKTCKQSLTFQNKIKHRKLFLKSRKILSRKTIYAYVDATKLI